MASTHTSQVRAARLRARSAPEPPPQAPIGRFLRHFRVLRRRGGREANHYTAAHLLHPHAHHAHGGLPHYSGRPLNHGAHCECESCESSARSSSPRAYSDSTLSATSGELASLNEAILAQLSAAGSSGGFVGDAADNLGDEQPALLPPETHHPPRLRLPPRPPTAVGAGNLRSSTSQSTSAGCGALSGRPLLGPPINSALARRRALGLASLMPDARAGPSPANTAATDAGGSSAEPTSQPTTAMRLQPVHASALARRRQQRRTERNINAQDFLEEGFGFGDLENDFDSFQA